MRQEYRVDLLYQQFQKMKDTKIRLNEFITHKDIKNQQKGPIYSLCNSLKRSTIAFANTPKEQLTYESKLYNLNFTRKDLSQMLGYILVKDEMLLPDRNFLRRILVKTFEEDLIQSGSRNFIHHLRLLELPEDKIVRNISQKQFYFVLKGKVSVTSSTFNYVVSEGEVFGQMEIMADTNIEAFYCQTNVLMLTLSDQHFNQYFRHYFDEKYKQKQHLVQCIKENFLDKIPLLHRYFFLNEVKQEIFSTGQKIVEEGKQVDKIYFIGHSWRSKILPVLFYGCLGLKETIKKKQNYEETVHSLQSEYKIPAVSSQIFIRYVQSQLNNLSVLMNKSAVDVNTKVDNPEKPVVNYMRIRKIRMSSNFKSAKTQGSMDSNIVTHFKFFKEQQMEDKFKFKSCVINDLPRKQIRSNKKINSMAFKTYKVHIF